jgi:hypothetical protein
VTHEVGRRELRAVVGNRTAIDAYRKGVRPFPDGTILLELAWNLPV